jgi:hypothetical protein
MAGSMSGEWNAPATARLLGSGDRLVRAGEDDLVGSVVVGEREAAVVRDLFHGRAVARANGKHSAAAILGPLGGLLHEAAAGGHQPETVLGGERVRGHQRRDLPERVAGHDVRLYSIAEHIEACEGGTVDRRLRPACAFIGALEEVVGNLRARDLEQVRKLTLDLLSHVRRLASLPREQQSCESVAAHVEIYSKEGPAVSPACRGTPRSGGSAGSRAARSSGQAEPLRTANCLGAVADLKFSVQRARVFLYRVRRQEEALRDLLVRGP